MQVVTSDLAAQFREPFAPTSWPHAERYDGLLSAFAFINRVVQTSLSFLSYFSLFISFLPFYLTIHHQIYFLSLPIHFFFNFLLLSQNYLEHRRLFFYYKHSLVSFWNLSFSGRRRWRKYACLYLISSHACYMPCSFKNLLIDVRRVLSSGVLHCVAQKTFNDVSKVCSTSIIIEMSTTHGPDDRDSKHLWNVSKLEPDYTAQYSRRESITFILDVVKT